MKTAFVIRKQREDTNNQNLDYLKIIEHTLNASEFNRIIVNSPLYMLAVDQYNTEVRNTMTRPSVPKWFCGKIEATTGELVPTYDDVAIRAVNQVTTTIPSGIPYLSAENVITYQVDGCLSGGVPGSDGYAKCSGASYITLSFTSVISGYLFDNLFNLV